MRPKIIDTSMSTATIIIEEPMGSWDIHNFMQQGNAGDVLWYKGYPYKLISYDWRIEPFTTDTGIEKVQFKLHPLQRDEEEPPEGIAP